MTLTMTPVLSEEVFNFMAVVGFLGIVIIVGTAFIKVLLWALFR